MESEEFVHQSPCGSLSYPDIAIQDPDDIAFCFPVGTTNVSDLGIRSEIIDVTARAVEQRIGFFDQDGGVELGEIGDQLFEDWIYGVLGCCDAKEDGQPFCWVFLVEGRCEGFVQPGLDALGWSDYGDMGDFISRKFGRYRRGKGTREVAEAGEKAC